MPIPVALLMKAAATIAQDERAQRVARSLLDVGSEAVEQRVRLWRARGTKPALPAPAIGPPTKGLGWRAGIDRRVRLCSGAAGDLIRFRYTDEHGLETLRTVGNWSSDGTALTGFCLNTKAVQSFTVSGIAQWQELTIPELEDGGAAE